MNLEDVQLGATYKLHFSPSCAKVKIYNDPLLSKEFSNKYAGGFWGDHQNREIVISHIPKTPVVTWFSNVTFHFKEDYSSCNASLPSDFFIEIPSTAASLAKIICQCNIWIIGCRCGVFQAEKR